MGKRYFITGATGCIGGWVVKNLIESGREVYALVRSPEKLQQVYDIGRRDALMKMRDLKHWLEGKH